MTEKAGKSEVSCEVFLCVGHYVLVVCFCLQVVIVCQTLTVTAHGSDLCCCEMVCVRSFDRCGVF